MFLLFALYAVVAAAMMLPPPMLMGGMGPAGAPNPMMMPGAMGPAGPAFMGPRPPPGMPPPPRKAVLLQKGMDAHGGVATQVQRGMRATQERY
eukprot:1152793-Pelagomonas_calceolata.AAC.4